MNVVLFWDNNIPFVTRLCQHLGISQEDDVVYSRSELLTTLSKSNKDAIIVLLESDLENHKRSDFYGLDIIKDIRKDIRFNGLVIAFSFCDQKYFREIKGTDILFTAGTRLKSITENGISAEEIEKLIDQVPYLSEELLDDIRYNVFDSKGKIHELLHNLKNELNNIRGKNAFTDFLKEVHSIFDRYKKLLLKEIDSSKTIELNKPYRLLVEESIADMKQHWDNKNKDNFTYTNAGNLINKFSYQIAELAPILSDDENTITKEKYNWEVLFFDDTLGVREKVVEYFNHKGVTCHLAATEEEVYQKLEEKNSQNISLFLTDIRLLDENGNWYDRQGYDVLEKIYKTPNYPPLVYSVLTSKKGTITKMIQKKRKYEILWFTKDDVINNMHSFNIFFDLVKEDAEQIFKGNTIFQPTLTHWKKPYTGHFAFPLKEYYKYHKANYKEYIEAETRINRTIVTYLENNINAECTGLDNLKFPGNSAWRMKLLAIPISETDLNHFRDTQLQGRRLVLAMMFFDEVITPEEILEKISRTPEDISVMKKSRKQIQDKNYKDHIQGKVKQIFNSHLSLSTDFETIRKRIREFAGNKNHSLEILIEEFDFLKKEFLDEYISTIDELGNDGSYLKTIVKEAIKTIQKNSLPLSGSLKWVMYLLNNDKNPKLERLDKMFGELANLGNNYQYLVSTETITFAISKIKYRPIKNLLRKYRWIE